MTRPVVLITGAARGIGRAIADNLAVDHDIAITYHTAAPEAAVFSSKNPSALVRQADLSTCPPADLIAEVMDHFGRIDGLVNNAGTIQNTSLDDYDPQAAAYIMQMNALVPLGLIAAATPHMKPGASIVNITSVNAKFPPVGAPVYGASKAALDSLTKSCAKALGPKGIRINALAPGAVERDYAPRPQDMIALFEKDTAMGQLATDAQIADTVRFLLSDAASGITGDTITVSAGYRL
ncbi:MAG: 3-oxoacyl-[acyl-carrier protein] reductase [Paracoccaceae bacterium]|jgi:3-oxoacyl-[acyl-carrier protein] reductase